MYNGISEKDVENSNNLIYMGKRRKYQEPTKKNIALKNILSFKVFSSFNCTLHCNMFGK